MVTDEFIVQAWGAKLIRFGPLFLANKLLPDDAKVFLQTVGLPKEFGVSRFPWALLDLDGIFETFDYESVPHTIIGRGSYGQRQCINSQDASVVLIQANLTMGYMNSSLRNFIIFLTLFHDLFSQFSGNIPKDKFLEMRAIMLSEDPLAFSHTRSDWSMIIEEVELELYG